MYHDHQYGLLDTIQFYSFVQVAAADPTCLPDLIYTTCPIRPACRGQPTPIILFVLLLLITYSDKTNTTKTRYNIFFPPLLSQANLT